ncbi:acyl carrier protein [Eubacterium maltosivorans]|uniref:acyl carrier protein n=1 Tax=Eubacterium TaxID=1730 RepID=UPI0008891B49|nr:MULTISPECIES: acyl carrier protein [Eubacterium]MDO5434317.1 acyl carrier protein [Eubacterium sp.]WPK80949.1 Acyl carrier protein [Eubacterium maltosivorans]SDP85638.1 acyl carrier protein [Eubacterium maltosivorans]
MEEKFAKVQEIIAEQLELDPAKITMESSLMEDLEADSLDIIELVMAFEEEFGVKMPDEELENIKTVGDIVNALQ